jgi:hypothetical protein
MKKSPKAAAWEASTTIRSVIHHSKMDSVLLLLKHIRNVRYLVFKPMSAKSESRRETV